MIIFSLLIALLIDRALRNRGHWQLKPIADTWSTHYQRYTETYHWARHPVIAPLLWVLPALLLVLLVRLQGSTLLLLIINVLVLLICLGAADKREAVRSYLSHAHRDEHQPCDQWQQRLARMQPELAGASVGSHIIWLNFRYYFAVIFWFIIFGALGALIYALLREFVVNRYQATSLATDSRTNRNDDAELDREAASTQTEAPARSAVTDGSHWSVTILHVLEWPAARAAGFAYLLVGHFSRGFPTWLQGLGDTTSNARYLISVARQADDSPQADADLCDEPASKLTLAKRSIILLLAIAALATLFGWLA